MELAEKQFGIPMVLEPEYLASPHLDELSGMTYLSYFMKEEDSPGYYATLDWVKKQIPNHRINNFRVRNIRSTFLSFKEKKRLCTFFTGKELLCSLLFVVISTERFSSES
jgi:hypothetical protein